MKEKYVAVCMCGLLYANINSFTDKTRYKVRARLVRRLLYVHAGPCHSTFHPRYELAGEKSISPAERGAPGGRTDPPEAIATETYQQSSQLFALFSSAKNMFCHVLSHCCESVGTTIRKIRLFFAGAVARQSKERLPSRVMFRTIAGGENPKPGGQCQT